MKVRLLYFAVLRELTGVEMEDVELAPGTRAADLWKQITEAHPRLRDYSVPPLTAINEEYASPERVLADGDEVAFIPPVSGG